MLNLIRIYIVAHRLYLWHVPLLPRLLQLLIFVVYNCSVSPRMRIGKGTFFSHGGIGVLINEKVEIGEGCVIGTNVSLIGQAPYRDCPRIGNRVFIGSGAVVQGPVIIEDNVIIAPNAVVNKSVRSGSVVGGIPARVLGRVEDLGYDIFSGAGKRLDGTRDFM